MNYKFYLTLAFIILANTVYSQKVANIKINSKALNQKREILVYTPPGYNESPYTYYDVIYVFDAQSRPLFDYTHSLISFLGNGSKHYIVVGITSPNNQKLKYWRNDDLLPPPINTAPKNYYGGITPNANNFLKYVKNEVVPYIDTHYRTLSNRIAVGHSLSASFIIYSFLKEPGLFNDYIAISPNFAYDKQRLVNDLYHFDYSKLPSLTYLYLSNANEGNGYWQNWIPAREKVYHLFKDSIKSDNLKVVIKQFPKENHWSTFPPSLNAALKTYFNTVYGQQQSPLPSSKEYNVTITVKVPNKNDEVYITGNQPSLANWNPGKIKMNRKSDYERNITLKMHSPAQFKFTRGNWETEAIVKDDPNMTNLTIKPLKERAYQFEIINWADRQ